MLTADQQRELALLASIGCDRQTVCHYVGCSPAELLDALRQRPEFAAQLARAEATAEVLHMRCIHDAVKESKNWRASVWWLERRAPERYGRRAPAGLTVAELQAVIEQLCDVIAAEIVDIQVRERLAIRLHHVAAELTHAFELPPADMGIDASADAGHDDLEQDDTLSESGSWQE